MSLLPLVDFSKNQILANLPDEESKRLLPDLQLLSPRLSDVVYRSGDPVRYAYFPLDAVVSILASMEDGRTVEVTLIGNEGIVGITALLGGSTSGTVAVVQVPGDYLRIKADVLQAEFRRGGMLNRRLLRYINYLLAQISQTAACNRLHRLEQRLARWLLMTHNRVQRDEFPITHEFLSHMLGTPRSEVTIAAGILQKSWLIRYGRGSVTILDRPGLEAVACECFQTDRARLNDPPSEMKL
ncbi:MAG: hypothetical protein A3F68_08625 [Acidobacteria bacterium RIFCSPLOWO2_12_FULL_54_10]|nr:MAG: hypothetical protein A3F68_08625 [Acidobacteria bacterium RIFCSPLOWO2_12_FULL_54_10]